MAPTDSKSASVRGPGTWGRSAALAASVLAFAFGWAVFRITDWLSPPEPVGLKLLEVLMRKSPAVIRRTVLEEALWGDELPDSDSLRSHIHQLRQIVDKPFETPLIHTVHGVGYSLSEPAQ